MRWKPHVRCGPIEILSKDRIVRDGEKTFESKTNNETANDESTLGLLGATVESSDENIATGKIVDVEGASKIEIKSLKEGSTTITVKDASNNVATIEITVAADGSITVGKITKYTVNE